MLDIPPLLLALAALVVACGVIVQSTTGMGFGLATAPILAMIDIRLVPVPVIALGALTAIIAAWSHRREVVAPEIGWALGGRIAGTFGAVGLLALMPERETFMLLFSVAILVAVAMSLVGVLIPLSRGTLVAMGTVSGLMGTISSVGAPPMGLIYQRVEPARARATLNAFFAIAAALSLAALALIGRVGQSDLIAIALFLPVMLVTSRLAPRFTAIVDRRYRPVILGLSAFAAITLLIRALS